MPLLFEEVIKACFYPPEERLKKLNACVERSNSAKDPGNIKEDIEWRSLTTIRDNVLAVRWIALED